MHSLLGCLTRIPQHYLNKCYGLTELAIFMNPQFSCWRHIHRSCLTLVTYTRKWLTQIIFMKWRKSCPNLEWTKIVHLAWPHRMLRLSSRLWILEILNRMRHLVAQDSPSWKNSLAYVGFKSPTSNPMNFFFFKMVSVSHRILPNSLPIPLSMRNS